MKIQFSELYFFEKSLQSNSNLKETFTVPFGALIFDMDSENLLTCNDIDIFGEL